MKLMVIVLCLLSERYLTHKLSLQRFGWFSTYSNKLLTFFEKIKFLQNPWILMLLVVLPWMAIIAIALCTLKSFLYGFLGFFMQLVIFYYCLGPNNVFYPITKKNKADAEEKAQGAHYFAAVNNELFGVIFWYILLGPLALLFYRLVSLCQSQSKLSDKAKSLMNLLDWAPARITSILYLLAGNFQQGIQCWLKKTLTAPAKNEELLSEIGLLATQGPKEDKVSLPCAQTLVEHAILICLVLLAIFTMVMIL